LQEVYTAFLIYTPFEGTSSWYPVGERLCIPYEAPHRRRVITIGAYFSHGPLAGLFEYQTWASVPPHARHAKRKTAEQVAKDYDLTLEEIGPDSQRLRTFFWRIAGRSESAACDWKRERIARSYRRSSRSETMSSTTTCRPAVMSSSSA